VPLELLAGSPSAACRASPIEVDGEPLEVASSVVQVPVAAGALQTVRVRFGSR